MDTFGFLMNGFATALQPQNLIFVTIGCLLGTLIGVLPGVGPAAGTAILIPITFALEPTPAIIMLAGIYYGCMYGGTITSILVNVPGEAASAITCLDGYQMAKQGRAGPALAIAAIGSFIGGNFAVMGLVLLALPLTALALKFGPPEFFCLMLVGLSLVTGLAGKSMVKALISAVFGLMVAMVGLDPVLAAPRYYFELPEMLDGFGIVPVAMGVFGIAEILINAESSASKVFDTKIGTLWISLDDAKRSFWPIVRGSLIGFFLGLIPGASSIVPTFMAYMTEKKMSKTPEKFGTGMIEGVAAPETANNAYANAATIPFFTLGIPSSPTMAVLMGAFMMNGLIPGPFLFRDHAQFVWAVIASLYIGNVILVILNLPLIPMWVALLKIPYSVLYGIILGFILIGAYSADNSTWDIGATLGFGLIGYIFKKMDVPLAPLILTLILGPLMERGLRQSLELSNGSFAIFLQRPIALGLLIIAVIFVLSTTLRSVRQVRTEDAQV